MTAAGPGTGVRLSSLAQISALLSRTPGRTDKIAALASFLRELPVPDVPVALSFLTGATRQGRLGLTAAAIRSAAGVAPALEPSLTLGEVDACFAALTALKGSGSTAARVARLRELFAGATGDEQDFLVRLLHGELRQGADEGLLLEGVAAAAGLVAERVRRAAMMAGDLCSVAEAVLLAGETALDRFSVRLFSPVLPMLAGTAASPEHAIAAFAETLLEFKLDGARVQVHKAGDEVRVYSRSLRDVTPAVPDIVDVVRALHARELILDGEVLALRPDGTPHPFQVTMRRFGRKADSAAVRASLPLSAFFFDCLYVDGTSLVDDPLADRVAVLDAAVPPAALVPRAVGATAAAADAFADRARDTGHEGIMAKDLASAYAAGRRGTAWLKVKPAHTLDLVVLAAEWGSGRRRGSLSNLHLGARDAERGGFVMLGKTFKGLTDELLAWQTRELLAREIGRDGHVVYVRPELVVEIAFNEIQESAQYPGRLTLRFARVRQYRHDKRAGEADTFQSIQALYRQITGLAAPIR